MVGKVFFSVTMSLDGFVAPESVPVDDFFAPDMQDDPDVRRWKGQWTELQQWLFPLRFIRENLKLGEGGEEGRDDDIAREAFERTGASVMGKRMFDLGEQAWTILEHLNAGLVDEFSITLSPVLFGAGTRLFEGVDASRVALEPVRSEPSSRVTHLTYAVHPR
ncbi:dihydrofolate reductase family protein [Streptomyces sp. NPDC004838]